MKMVLQKYLAQAGLCSRRKAEELISGNKVKVNGRKADLGARVDESDQVEINGKAVVLPKKKTYIILNKPIGYTCTNRRFEREKNVFDLVKSKERLFVVGRLDKNSRGLILLTNDGELAQKTTHPKYKQEKEYEVVVEPVFFAKQAVLNHEKVTDELKKGVDIGAGDGVVKIKEAKYLGKYKFRIIITEGKKRQIRRMLKKIGYEVKDLKRTRIGRIKIDSLKQGAWQEIKI